VFCRLPGGGTSNLTPLPFGCHACCLLPRRHGGPYSECILTEEEGMGLLSVMCLSQCHPAAGLLLEEGGPADKRT